MKELRNFFLVFWIEPTTFQTLKLDALTNGLMRTLEISTGY